MYKSYNYSPFVASKKKLPILWHRLLVLWHSFPFSNTPYMKRKWDFYKDADVTKLNEKCNMMLNWNIKDRHAIPHFFIFKIESYKILLPGRKLLVLRLPIYRILLYTNNFRLEDVKITILDCFGYFWVYWEYFRVYWEYFKVFWEYIGVDWEYFVVVEVFGSNL